jgi:formimidoylglutamate deiminase
MVHDCGANIIVCPTTEANLGDGIFPWSKFSEIANGSNLGFGTDANLSVSLWEELRTFEYSQRFIHRKRTIAAPRGCHHVADSLFESAWNTGMKNFSQDNYLNKGAPFDGLLVDGSCSTLAGCSLQNTLSRLCFRSQSNNWLKRVWTRGKIRKIEK